MASEKDASELVLSREFHVIELHQMLCLALHSDLAINQPDRLLNMRLAHEIDDQVRCLVLPECCSFQQQHPVIAVASSTRRVKLLNRCIGSAGNAFHEWFPVSRITILNPPLASAWVEPERALSWS